MHETLATNRLGQRALAKVLRWAHEKEILVSQPKVGRFW
jgi:hypothetical protein